MNNKPLKTGIDKNSNKIFIQEADKKFLSIEEYKNMIREEFKQGKTLSHPNLLNYYYLDEKPENISISYYYVPAQKLNNALLDNNYDITKTGDSKNLILQLLDAVEYLHNRDICHFNIKPENILIRKSDNHIFLYNISNKYYGSNLSFLPFSGEYCAPECFEDDKQLTERSDIYSIGKIISLVYSHSHYSYAIRKIIKKATNKNPDKRYHNIASLRKDIKSTKFVNFIIAGLKTLSVIIVILSLYCLLKSDNEEKVNFIIEDFNKKATADNNFENSQTYKYTDTLVSGIDTSKSITQRYIEMCEKSFEDEYTERARNIIKTMYTKQTMSGDQEMFIKQNDSKIKDLDSIQKVLTQKYGISPYSAIELSSDIISKLTDERIEYLNNGKR